jgi:hypothetical protein
MDGWMDGWVEKGKTVLKDYFARSKNIDVGML